ncbi:MAG: hypothetical protein GY834_07505 [Bacteroidetes bacterium]|jgi:chromosomal replication initiation ATPase DnaA|nr:hypothetical protein [Bacteroidota bacterium]
MKKQIFDDYATAVAKKFHLTLDEMFTSTRRGDIVDARQMLYYLCMERPIRISYIQRFLETYDFKVTHSTIIHGYNKAKDLISNDTDVNDLVQEILKDNNV